MKKTFGWAAIAIIAGFVCAAAYYAWNAETPSAPQPPPAPAPTPPTAPAAAPPPHYAIEPLPAPAAAPLPVLEASDGAVGDELARLLGGKSLPAYFYPDRMIRRFVATIDNLPRRHAPARMMPVKPVAGAFVVAGVGDRLAIDPANSARYARYVDLMEAVDVPGLVDLYVRFYPLFQQAYRELGYPKGYFNDRLVEALDDLLAAPDVPTPAGLVQRKVLYEFADPELEARSAGQKIMVRMGGGNAARVKGVLRAIRGEVVRRASGK